MKQPTFTHSSQEAISRTSCLTNEAGVLRFSGSHSSAGGALSLSEPPPII